MDWAKAKNILIIAFIITNLLLLYAIVESENPYDLYPTMNTEFIEDVKARLAEKDIEVKTEIPKEVSSLPILSIKYELYNSPELLTYRFLENYIKEEKDGNKYFLNEQESLQIVNNKRLIYTNSRDYETYNGLDIDKINEISKQFIDDKGFSTEDYRLNRYRVENGTHYVEYTKSYKDMSIESGYMKFEIDEGGIKRFERQWISTITPNEGEIIVRTAPDALLRLLLNERIYGKIITDIELCYYTDPESIVDMKRITQDNVIPAWKIRFQDGTTEFLKEY